MPQEVYIILAVGFIVFILTYLYQWVTYLNETTQDKISKGFKLFQWTGKYTQPKSDWEPGRKSCHKCGRYKFNKKYSGSDYFKNKDSLEQYLKSKDIELLWCEDITGENND